MIAPKNKNISFYTHPLFCVFSSLLTLHYKRKFLSSCPLRCLQFCLNSFLYYNSLFPFIAIILSNEVSFYVTVDLFLFDDRSHQILCLFLIMYTLSLRFGAVCGNNENVRFIFVFSSCLNLPWSLTVPIPVSVNFCFYFSLWVCCCISLSTYFSLFLHLPVSWRPSSCLQFAPERWVRKQSRFLPWVWQFAYWNLQPRPQLLLW